jgi:hypothetical protein
MPWSGRPISSLLGGDHRRKIQRLRTGKDHARGRTA